MCLVASASTTINSAEDRHEAGEKREKEENRNNATWNKDVIGDVMINNESENRNTFHNGIIQ